MAQKRLFQYKDDDSTYDLNRRLNGVIEPGLYRGFDFDVSSTGLSLVLSHTVSGFTDTRVDGTVTPMSGKWISRQGTAIIEDAPITIQVTGNAGGSPRIDLIVGEAAFTEISGGAAAGYTVIQGIAASTPVAPALTFPAKQVILGQIYWPAGASGITSSGVTFTQALIPDLGGGNRFMHLAGEQTITGSKQFNHIYGVGTPMAYDTGASALIATVRSNFYEVAAVSPGTFMYVDFIYGAYSVSLNHFEILTHQELHLINNTHVQLPAGQSDMYIRAGETFEVWYMQPGSDFATIVRGGELRRDTQQKMLSGIIQNKGTATINANGEVTLDGKGNFYDLFFDFAVSPILKGVSSSDAFSTGVNSTRGGNVIMLRLSRTGSVSTITIADSATVAAGIKSFATAAGTMTAVDAPILLALVENETQFHIAALFSPTYNTYNVTKNFTAYTQPYEHQWTKLQSLNRSVGSYDPVTGFVVVGPEANAFVVDVPVGPSMIGVKDIKMDKLGNGIYSDLVVGTILSITFTCSTGAAGNPVAPWLSVSPGNPAILSSLSDANVSPGGSASQLSLTIPYQGQISESFIFEKTGQGWLISNYGKEADIYTRVKANTTDITAFKNPPSWTTFSTFGNAWGMGAMFPAYRKTADGLVHLRGRFKATSGSSDSFPGTLPVGYRPFIDMAFPVTYITTGGRTATDCFINVLTTGVLQLYFTGNWSNAYELDISNIAFAIN